MTAEAVWEVRGSLDRLRDEMTWDEEKKAINEVFDGEKAHRNPVLATHVVVLYSNTRAHKTQIRVLRAACRAAGGWSERPLRSGFGPWLDVRVTNRGWEVVGLTDDPARPIVLKSQPSLVASGR
jgi:hypothetical protein